MLQCVSYPERVTYSVTGSSLKEYCHNQCVYVCVRRCRSGDVYCVIGGRLAPAVGSGYWEFDVLHQEKATCKEVQRLL